MNYKKILSNIIERESRATLMDLLNEKDLQIDLDFGTVSYSKEDSDKLFTAYQVDFPVLGKPWHYQVIGIISNNTGYVSSIAYKHDSGATWISVEPDLTT